MYCMQCLLKSKYIKSRTFNDKNRGIIKKVLVFKKLLQHLATRGTYSPGDWMWDEAWREQTLVYPPVMCQQRLIYCTWELNIMMSVQFVATFHFISRKYIWNSIYKTFTILFRPQRINTLRLRQNGRHFTDDTFKYIFLNENIIISATISLKFVPKGLIDNIPPLVQIMAWRQPGNKPLSEPMMVRLPTHICVTRPQRVKDFNILD